jgi:hypothetical protein
MGCEDASMHNTPVAHIPHTARRRGRLSVALLACVARHERGAAADDGPLQLLHASSLFHFVRSANVWSPESTLFPRRCHPHARATRRQLEGSLTGQSAG